jgi:hypothetical protein
MEDAVLRFYKRLRQNAPYLTTGTNAQSHLRDARMLAEWDEYEALGLVRIRVKDDPFYERHDFDGAERCTEDYPCAECRAIERGDGPCVTISEWRLSVDDEWEEADSCWGHVGYDRPDSPFENPYVIDHMHAALRALTDAILASFGDTDAR